MATPKTEPHIPSYIAFHGINSIRNSCLKAVDNTYHSGAFITLSSAVIADNMDAEKILGIPSQLFHCLDMLCIDLEQDAKYQFFSLFLNAVKAGTDLSFVWPHFVHWQLNGYTYGLHHNQYPEGTHFDLDKVAKMYHAWRYGTIYDAEEWQDVRDHLDIQHKAELKDAVDLQETCDYLDIKVGDDIDIVVGGLVDASGFIKPSEFAKHPNVIRGGILDALTHIATLQQEATDSHVDKHANVAAIGKAIAHESFSQIQCHELLNIVALAPVCTIEQVAMYQCQHTAEIEKAHKAAA